MILQEAHGPHGSSRRTVQINKLEFSSSKDALCQFWLKLVQWFWRTWKCKQLMTTTTDNGQILIRKVHSSLRVSWAKKVLKHFKRHIIWTISIATKFPPCHLVQSMLTELKISSSASIPSLSRSMTMSSRAYNINFCSKYIINKRSMGHITYLINQFKSIKLCLYHNVD